MKLTCSKCFGNKTYRGMGSMIVKCEPCNGMGHIEITTTLPINDKKETKKSRKGTVDEETSNIT